jgi:hypothetical protein
LIKSLIIDSTTGKSTVVDNDSGNETSGLVVASRELKTYTNRPKFFLNGTYGIDMNLAIAWGASPEPIYNGGDDAYWAISTLVGGAGDFIEESGDQSHTDTNSLDATPSAHGDTILLTDAAAGSISMGDYAAITGWIYITGWSLSGIIGVELQARNTAVDVGTAINIGNYVDTAVLGAWQQFTIPKIDMGLSSETVNELTIMTVDIGSGLPPDYYIDDLQWEESGTINAVRFDLTPSKGTWLHVDEIKIIMADAHTGIVTVADASENASLANIAYNKFLSVSALDTGIVFQKYSKGTAELIGSAKQLSDFLQFPGSSIDSFGGDGTNAWLTIKFVMPAPWVLKAEYDEYLSMTINDPLNGLLLLRMSAGCREEER